MIKLPLAIRLKNPLNIIQGRNPWIGQVGTFSANGLIYCEFDSFEHGMRAALYLLRKYVFKYNLRTIDAIISRWCPDATRFNYIRFVKSRLSHFEPTYTSICELAVVMFQFESGMLDYPRIEPDLLNPFHVDDWLVVYKKYFYCPNI